MALTSDTPLRVGAPATAELKILQKQLWGLGCWPKAQLTESAFGEDTEAAVENFQRSRGFETIDGVAYPTIRAALQSEVSDLQFAVQSFEENYHPLRRGCFDEDLAVALERLQSENELPPTGVLSPETLEIVRRKRKPTSFQQQLSNELDAVLLLRGVGRDDPFDADASIIAAAREARLFGLAFSGGGIRSATFNLGVIQSLASVGLLKQVDYLSTVSGGGYIGSWLSAWISRQNGCPAAVETELGGRQEPRQVQWLRSFSNYITPRTGVLGIDFLQMVVTWVRNVLLNQYILVAFLCLALLLPWALAFVATVFEKKLLAHHWLMVTSVGALGATALASSGLGFRSARISSGERPYWKSVGYIVSYLYCLAGLFFGVSLLAADNLSDNAPAIAFGGFCVYVVSWNLGWVLSFLMRGKGFEWKSYSRAHMAALRGSLAAGLVFALALYTLASLWGNASGLYANEQRLLHATVIGLPIATGFILLSLTAHIGFAGRGLGEPLREWWSRMGAVIVRTNLFWLALAGTALYGPFGVLYADKWAAAGGLAWLATTVGGAFAGASVRTGDKTNGGKLDVLARFAPFVFCIGLMIFISFNLYRAIDRIWSPDGSAVGECVVGGSGDAVSEQPTAATTGARAERVAPQAPCSFSAYSRHIKTVFDDVSASLSVFTWKWLPGFIFFVSALVLAFFADVNVFSLHMFYRNRLERCYLGASNKDREEDDFTGLDTNDSPRLSCLVQRPLPIINTALNITKPGNLAWQERKSASFTFTPFYCGFQFENEKGDQTGAYQPTRDYVGSEKSPGWISLIMPVTISGAAASPNWGYHTNPATSFLMTMFDVRLGWWMQNPLKGDFWRHAGPKWASRSLLNELTGSTTSEKGFVYLSDGGHFENLGLYELVRRRCRYIIVCDAGCDPHLQFEDLGNAIRKIRIDMGVDIEINVRPLLPDPQNGRSLFHCALGKVKYQCVDTEAQSGYLLYIKPTFCGQEPTDVRQYRDLHPSFPHETTGDQWFAESQFESYRKLGCHIANVVVADCASIGVRDGKKAGHCDLEVFFRSLSERWFAPSAAGQSFSNHGDSVMQIFERLRSDPNLKFLDAQIYPEWPYMTEAALDRFQPRMRLPETYAEFRAGFYVCNQMIQLMENVYNDLELEVDYEHPNNRGWINLFRHWSWSGMFRAAWAVSASTYGARFQTFCREKLDLRTATIVNCDLGFAFSDDRLALQSTSDHVEGALLNFVERSSLSKIWAYYDQSKPRAKVTVIPLRLRVLDPMAMGTDDGLFEFTFGVAVVDESNRTEPVLLYFRVQDHIRAAGLGTRALRKLRERWTSLVLGELDKEVKIAVSDEDRSRLTRLAESVEIRHRRGGNSGSKTAPEEARSKEIV